MTGAAVQRRDLVPPGCPLTVKELRVVRAIADGLTYDQAARQFGVSAATVRTQAHTAIRRLGVAGGVQAAIRCWREGWLDDEPASGRERPCTPADVDRKVTWRQRLYLEAFDRHLDARDEHGQEQARALMDMALDGVLAERAVTVPRRLTPGDPLLRLLDAVEST